MRRLIAPLTALVVLAGLIALFRIAQRYDPSLERRGDVAPDVSIRLEKATILSREEGLLRWKMSADRIDLKPDAYGGLESFRAAEFDHLHDGVFYRAGKPEAFFSARRATFSQAEQQFTIDGGLKLHTPQGDRMESEECIWSERDDFVRLPSGAKGVFHGNKVSAPSLLFSPKTRVVQCPLGAEGVFEGDPLRAAALFWDVNAETVHCTGPIFGQRRSLSFTTEEAFLDLKNHTIRMNKGTAQFRIGDGDDELEKLTGGTKMTTLSKSAHRLRKAAALSGTAVLMGSLTPVSYAQDTQSKPVKGTNGADKTVALSSPTTPAKPEPTAKKKVTPWNIKFVSANHNDSTGEGEASNVTAVSDEGTNILSDEWKWNDKTKLAHATGNLKMTDPQADATGDKADIEYGKGKRILTLTNNVVILVKPKKDKEAPAPGPAPVIVKDGKAEIDNSADDENSTKSARKYPATITCDKAVYEYARTKKHATLTGHFKVVQKLPKKTRTLTADYAEWFGLEERILLHGPVHIEDTEGTVFDTKEDVTVSVKEGDENVKMKNGIGIIPLKGDDEDEPDNGGKTPPPADAGTPPKKKS